MIAPTLALIPALAVALIFLFAVCGRFLARRRNRSKQQEINSLLQIYGQGGFRGAAPRQWVVRDEAKRHFQGRHAQLGLSGFSRVVAEVPHPSDEPLAFGVPDTNTSKSTAAAPDQRTA